MFLSWLAAQMLTADGTEGRGLHTILLPPALRRLLFREREVVQEGDIRGAERQQSADEGSVRAYKVSKTYAGSRSVYVYVCCMVCCRGQCTLFFRVIVRLIYPHFVVLVFAIKKASKRCGKCPSR